MSTSITSKGQVTIPKAVRDRLGLRTGSRVRFELAPDGHIVLLKADGDQPAPAGFAKLRGIAGPGPSTDDIMAMTRGEP
jgi:AbrB family looped-hinge helix DNA binding protein